MLADQTRLKVSGDVHVYEVLRGHRADLPKRPKRAEELPESHIVAQSADSTSYKQYCEVMDSFDSHDSYNILQHVSVEDFAAREAHWRSDFGLERMLLDMVKTADSSDTALKIIAACTAFVTDWHNTAKFFPTTRDDVQVGDIYGIDPVLQPSPSNVRIVDDYTIDGTQLLHKQTVVAKWDVNSYSWNNLRPGNTTIQKLLQKRYEISDVCMLLGFWHRAQKGIVTNLRRLVVANCSNKLYSVINSCFPFESEEVKGLVDQGIKHRIANLDEGRFLDDFEAMAGQMLPADLCVPSSQTELRTVKELNAILLILEEIAEMDHAELSALCGENTPAKVAFKRQCETLAEHVRGMSYLVGANHQVVSMRPSTLHRHGASPLHQETASDSEDEVSDGVFDVNLMDVIDALVDNDEMFNQADESVQDSAAAVAKKTPVEGAERASFWSTYSERKMTRGTPISTGVLTDYIVQVKLTFNSECMSFHPAETVSVCIKVARADQYLRMLLQTKPAVALCALLTEDGSPVFVLDNSDTSREMTDVEKSELYAALLFSSGIAHEDCRMIKALPC